MLAALLLAASLVPIHGTVLAVQHDGTAILRNDAAPEMLASQTRRYRISPRTPLVAGTGVDGFADLTTTPWTLRDAVPAGPFVPGLPNPGRVIGVDVGSPLPAAQLVDQAGRLVVLQRAFRDKTLLLTFVFTRCPDRTLCPAISGKYAYVQSHLDPAHFALVEITLDPPYDSPRILADYARSYGANPAIWSLLTGEGSTIQRLLDEFGIDSMRVSASNFIHSDRLFIVAANGRVAYVVESGAWDPDGVIAEARSVGGLASNPFERFKLSLVADAVAFCGGSQWAGIVLLELSLFVIIAAFVAAGLWLVARMLWGKA
jgi:protein SCO1/2